jgi:hypothetical protein
MGRALRPSFWNDHALIPAQANGAIQRRSRKADCAPWHSSFDIRNVGWRGEDRPLWIGPANDSSFSLWERIMIDDQVNLEELEESRRRREAAENATDDGMPVLPEDKERDPGLTQTVPATRWIRRIGDGRKNWLFIRRPRIANSMRHIWVLFKTSRQSSAGTFSLACD